MDSYDSDKHYGADRKIIIHSSSICLSSFNAKFRLFESILLSFAGELSKTAVWGSYHIAVKSIIFVEMKVVDYIFHQTSPSYI